MTKSAALEYGGQGIRINSAESVVFLVSPRAKYITGAVIDVAAGANAKYTA